MQTDVDSAFGESKPLRYFLVTQTFRHYPDDLAFTRSEQVTLMVSYPGHFFKGCGMLVLLNQQRSPMFRVQGRRVICSLTWFLLRYVEHIGWFREAKAS